MRKKKRLLLPGSNINLCKEACNSSIPGRDTRQETAFFRCQAYLEAFTVL